MGLSSLRSNPHNVVRLQAPYRLKLKQLLSSLHTKVPIIDLFSIKSSKQSSFVVCNVMKFAFRTTCVIRRTIVSCFMKLSLKI